MERKLMFAFGGLSLVLALALAGTLSLVAGLAPASTAWAQGLGNALTGGCARSGLSAAQMPCLAGNSSVSATGATPTGITLTGNVAKDAEAAALAYYRLKYGVSEVTVKATDYGCHVQADVYQGGKVIKSLGYDRAGGIYELG